MSQRRKGPPMRLRGCMEVPDMTISVMKGQPDRAPARRWDSQVPPWLPTLVRMYEQKKQAKQACSGLIPRVEVEEPGCCSRAEEGCTEKSKQAWRDVGITVGICKVENPRARAVMVQERGGSGEER